MNASELISDLDQQDIRLSPDGDRLLVDAPKGKLTPELREVLKAHKPELMATLSQNERSEYHGLTLAELQDLAGDDWPDIKDDPATLAAFAHAVMTRHIRERGAVPPDYAAITECSQCGSVPIWEGCPETVQACPWCFNRIGGRPAPVVSRRAS